MKAEKKKKKPSKPPKEEKMEVDSDSGSEEEKPTGVKRRSQRKDGEESDVGSVSELNREFCHGHSKTNLPLMRKTFMRECYPVSLLKIDGSTRVLTWSLKVPKGHLESSTISTGCR